jgi:hypothetical protein
VSVALRRRLNAVGAALAKAGRIRLPEGPAAAWTDDEVDRVSKLVDISGWALLARFDNADLTALSERWRGRDEEAARF